MLCDALSGFKLFLFGVLFVVGGDGDGDGDGDTIVVVFSS